MRGANRWSARARTRSSSRPRRPDVEAPPSPGTTTRTDAPSRRRASRRTPSAPPTRPAEQRQPESTARGPHAAGALPRARHRRPDFDWQVPSARLLDPLDGRAARPDTAGQEQVAAALIEALGHFGVEAKVIGTVTGPHITRYELRLAPGIKVAKVAQPQGRSRLRAGRDRHPDPRADPRQAGGRGRGSERQAADRPPRRRLPGSARRLVAADGLARQGRRGPRDRRRPGEDAAPARRRHDRRRQVGVRQRDALEHPAAGHARTRCASCWSTPSRSSSTTTSRSRTC